MGLEYVKARRLAMRRKFRESFEGEEEWESEWHDEDETEEVYPDDILEAVSTQQHQVLTPSMLLADSPLPPTAVGASSNYQTVPSSLHVSTQPITSSSNTTSSTLPKSIQPSLSHRPSKSSLHIESAEDRPLESPLQTGKKIQEPFSAPSSPILKAMIQETADGIRELMNAGNGGLDESGSAIGSELGSPRESLSGGSNVVAEYTVVSNPSSANGSVGGSHQQQQQQVRVSSGSGTQEKKNRSDEKAVSSGSASSSSLTKQQQKSKSKVKTR